MGIEMQKSTMRMFAEMKYSEAKDAYTDAQERVKNAKNAASMRVNMARQHEAERNMQAAKWMMDAAAR
jgi:hypothetical protein